MAHPDVDPAILQAAAARRGRLHVYEEIVPARTALVVIDLQNAFMRPGAPSEVPNARTIVPAVNRLAEKLRKSGGTVAWVQATFEREGWPLFFDHMVRPELAARILAALRSNSPDHALWPELVIAPDDIVVPKYRFSAFLPGASTLPAVLRGRGVDTILIAGCMTNMCCDFIGARRHHDRLSNDHDFRLQRGTDGCRAFVGFGVFLDGFRRCPPLRRSDREVHRGLRGDFRRWLKKE